MERAVVKDLIIIPDEFGPLTDLEGKSMKKVLTDFTFLPSL